MIARERMYLATIGTEAPSVAYEYGFGLELDQFCVAENMDSGFSKYDRIARDAMAHSDRLIFHAPYMEISPCAIDPMIRDVSFHRLLQAGNICAGYGIERMVVHSGFIPRIYYPEWYIEKAPVFFQELIAALPRSVNILIENVLDPDPALLVETIDRIDSERVGICLDIGHAGVSSGLRITDWIEAMGTGIRHFHVHDNHRKRDEHLIPGQGELGFPELFEVIDRTCATMTFECINARECAETIVKMNI